MQAFERFRSHVEKVGELFAAQTAHHQLAVLSDGSDYVHARASADKPAGHDFDVFHWPGHVAVSTSRATHVLSAPGWKAFTGRVEPGWWSEQVLVAPPCGIRTETFAAARATLTDLIEHHQFEHPDDSAIGGWQANVVDPASKARDLSLLLDAVQECPSPSLIEGFSDADRTDYTHDYLWCCHALHWTATQLLHRRLQLVV